MNNFLPSRIAASGCMALGLFISVIPTRSDQHQSAQPPTLETPYMLSFGEHGEEGLVLSHNGKFAAYFSDRVTVLDLSTRKVLWQRNDSLWDIDRLAVSSNGLYVAGIGSEQNRSDPKGEMSYVIYIVNTQTKKVLKVPSYAQSLAFSPDSNALVVAGSNALVSYNVKTGDKIQTFWKEGLSGYMDSGSMKFSPNGKLLAVGTQGGSSDGHVRVWNFDTGKLIHDFSNAYNPVVFSPDSKFLATSADDPQPEPDGLPPGSYTESARFAFQDFAIKVWDLTNGSVQVLKHAGRQTEGTADPKAFSYDGRLLLTANDDLWDVRANKFVGRRENLRKRGQEIRFSRSGTFVVADTKSKR